jgi:pimeloyl-ACP methyl ester carboxylesterase
MSHFVLVHGAWHGGWCWADVAAALRASGHGVSVAELPGRGADTRPHSVITLEDYVRSVADLIALQAQPVVLVGHSMGGITITQVAEAMPERIARLVYVTAFLPRNGTTLLDYSATVADTPLQEGIEADPAAGSMRLKSTAVARDAFYNCCEPRAAEAALARLVPEPMAAAATAVRTSPERFGRVPRWYVECLQDRAITPQLQRRMQAEQPCERVLRLDTDHSPFLSTTAALATLLAAV